ncbi:glycoside hydrolase family 1 protein [Nocardioides sp. J54]|uniref:glycoside hydrolase family 1 protein n=1 Tax=Nocardioides sp. J54 TaxID=935866 RepID=UPI0004BC6C49|nr:family 1 glycosylhydrolase [Nocardioides sp. J54]
MTSPTPTPAQPTDGEPTFPADFLWGAATAAYQIEGAASEDGRTPSIWDTFSRVPGAVRNGDTGDVACDHYHRMPEDVALVRDLGLGSYRFSIAWPRVRPDGGAPNPAGIGFYDRLVDELLGAGVLPWATLYHWDLPQALEDAGGWLERDTVERYVEYALTIHEALGDRVHHWTTFNEPWCSAFLGYTGGQHAPGRQEGVAGVIAAHHLLLAHGRTVEELRRRAPEDQLGITLNLTLSEPFDTGEPADVAAAERVDQLWNRVFLEPVLRGKYDDGLAAHTEGMTWRGRAWQEFVLEGDLEVISAPLDFLGVNYYHGDAASGREHPAADLLGSRIPHPSRPTSSPFPGGDGIVFPRRGLPVTGIDWEVQPDGLRDLLVGLARDYDLPPVYITENGAAYPDEVAPDGTVHDPERVTYFHGHLRALHEAMAAGVDVRGYFAWSLLDNFEWAYGYEQRFGIVHCDFENQRRTPKSSARLIAEVARTGRLPEVG